MGAGFVFFVAPADVARALAAAPAHGPELLVAGPVEYGPKRVELRPLGITFEGESLAIRG
jgi:hypothetical protein